MIIILDENGLRTTILSFIAIISGTIYCPAKFVIVTGLLPPRPKAESGNYTVSCLIVLLFLPRLKSAIILAWLIK